MQFDLRFAIIQQYLDSSFTGDVKYHDVTGDSGGIVSPGFCPNCGSQLFGKPSMPEVMGITAGSLDDPSEFQPGRNFYTVSAQKWDYMNPELPKFALPSPPNNSIAVD